MLPFMKSYLLQPYVFNRGLETGATGLGYLHELTRVVSDVVPGAVQGHRHVCVLALSERGGSN